MSQVEWYTYYKKDNYVGKCPDTVKKLVLILATFTSMIEASKKRNLKAQESLNFSGFCVSTNPTN